MKLKNSKRLVAGTKAIRLTKIPSDYLSFSTEINLCSEKTIIVN